MLRFYCRSIVALICERYEAIRGCDGVEEVALEIAKSLPIAVLTVRSILVEMS